MPLEDGLRREYYLLDKIPKQVQQTFIDAEDKYFYYHPGVDLFSIIRASTQNKKADRIVSGASTITMQLARMIYPRDKKKPITLGIKIKEAFIALRIESKISKKKILELYLNNVPFGFQIEGVGSAARSFYGVELSQLTLPQIKMLSQIPRRPSEYAPPKSFSYPQKCPHFVTYVIDQYRKDAQLKCIPDALTLSVDNELCEVTERMIQQKISDYQDARIHNGSALVINNRTGEIIVWVGNGDFKDEHGGQIDGVLVNNQPGSSMKPFLYALAIEGTVPESITDKEVKRIPLKNKFEPTTILPDIPQDFGSSKVYVPLNFNNRYNGPVRMRVALASSLNIPAVYLLYNIGVRNYLQQLSLLGFTSLNDQKNSLGLSLALGSGEVSLYEMVNAFSVFPRDGFLSQCAYLSKGPMPNTSLTKEQQTGGHTTRAYSADTARIICDMLSDKSARALGFGHAKVFDTPYPCIFKTGTSNQFQNIIALGATSEFTAGVWLGNFEGETVIKQTGSSIPATIVRQLLDTLTPKYGALPFAQPEAYVKQNVCTLSGMMPTNDCPSVTQEYVLKKRNEPSKLQSCTWHTRFADGHVQINYPSEYQHWLSNRNMAGTFSQMGTQLDFLYPTDGAVFVFDPTIPQNAQSLRIQVIGGSVEKADLFIDDSFVGSAKTRFCWNVPLTKGIHRLTVECGREEKSIMYSVE